MLNLRSCAFLVLVAATLAIPTAAAGSNLMSTTDSPAGSGRQFVAPHTTAAPQYGNLATDPGPGGCLGAACGSLQLVADTDGDGCSDAQELAPASQASLGGGRDPNNFWDVYSVWTGIPPQKVASVTILEVASVVVRFGSTRETPLSQDQAVAEEQLLTEAAAPPPAAPAYHAAFDRGGPIPGENRWNLLPPDGHIGIADIGAVVAQFGLSCVSDQRPVVQTYVDQSQLVRVACLDVNNDGTIDAGDADPASLPDITGDGAVDDADLAVIKGTDISLAGGRPDGCAGGQPKPDWQFTPAAPVDCTAGETAVMVLGVNGGGFDPVRGLDDAGFAVGVRWMVASIGEALEAQGTAAQLASMTPGLDGADEPVLAGEAWASTYLAAQLNRTPCLNVVLLGQSWGGMLVKAVATRLEEAGLSDRILMTIFLDLVPGFYQGTVSAMPQISPAFNIYQTNDTFFPPWHDIDQPNVENWDASAEVAPEFAGHGGPLVPITHSNIANSEGVLDRVIERVLDKS